MIRHLIAMEVLISHGRSNIKHVSEVLIGHKGLNVKYERENHDKS